MEKGNVVWCVQIDPINKAMRATVYDAKWMKRCTHHRTGHRIMCYNQNLRWLNNPLNLTSAALIVFELISGHGKSFNIMHGVMQFWF